MKWCGISEPSTEGLLVDFMVHVDSIHRVPGKCFGYKYWDVLLVLDVNGKFHPYISRL